jgi:hypothetical protein
VDIPAANEYGATTLVAYQYGTFFYCTQPNGLLVSYGSVYSPVYDYGFYPDGSTGWDVLTNIGRDVFGELIQRGNGRLLLRSKATPGSVPAAADYSHDTTYNKGTVINPIGSNAVTIETYPKCRVTYTNFDGESREAVYPRQSDATYKLTDREQRTLEVALSYVQNPIYARAVAFNNTVRYETVLEKYAVETQARPWFEPTDKHQISDDDLSLDEKWVRLERLEFDIANRTCYNEYRAFRVFGATLGVDFILGDAKLGGELL